MKIDNFGEVILSKEELFEAFYRGTVLSMSDIYLDDDIEVSKYNNSVDKNADKIKKVKTVSDIPSITNVEYDSAKQHVWFTPKKYREFPILDWLLAQCTTEAQKTRVREEFVLFETYKMIDVLLYLKYLVDTMRDNKIVWGVGRGSSVASYILFLIGVHKIDSIKYNLDIREFLR